MRLRSPNGREVVIPRDRAEWRSWLTARPDRVEGVWVAVRKKSSNVAGPSYDDLVEEALCFGWIDGQAARGDDDLTLLWFSPRRKGSGWAASNKERVERLIAAGSMTNQGLAVVEQAKADGSWTQYDDAENLVIHGDLAAAFRAAPDAFAVFEALAPSHKKAHLGWIYSAKRPDTRERRIAETIRRLTESRSSGP